MRRVLRIAVTATLGLFALVLSRCSETSPPTGTEYLNWNDTVEYVGAAVCANCHADIAHSFAHTGMGLSFDRATPEKSALFDKNVQPVYDEHLNFWYLPLWKDSTLFILEYRLEGTDTVHRRLEKVDHVIGSGHHTNSHLMERNGFVFQMPLTYYTQKGIADLPPGYENGNNSRFSRLIGLECMSCHNALPVGFQWGSTNVFRDIGNGIDCERCHGPGELHVKGVLAGQWADTSAGPDLRIVNPKRLPVQLQMELCQRCHLQGNAVLAEGKSFLDFKPGQELKTVMDVYLPRHEGEEDHFIMASHADRLKMSACFRASDGALTCITCHNPHIPLEELETDHYNLACAGCHGTDNRGGCTVGNKEFRAGSGDCSGCHLPLSGSTDIPHVTVHDHYIRKKYEKRPEPGTVLGLRSVNNPSPEPRSRILAHIQQVELFNGPAWMLDTAEALLERLPESWENKALGVRLDFLRGDYPALVRRLKTDGDAVWLDRINKKSLDNDHAWTAYRIGEAYLSVGLADRARPYLERAAELAPLIPDFQSKLALCLVKLGLNEEATQAYGRSLEMVEAQPSVLASLAFLELSGGHTASAERLLKTSLRLNPDEVQAWLNLASLNLETGKLQEARKCLEEVLRIAPDHPRAIQGLALIDSL